MIRTLQIVGVIVIGLAAVGGWNLWRLCTTEASWPARVGNGLIAAAYDLNPRMTSGGPGWAETDRYDVIAATPGPMTPDGVHIGVADFNAVAAIVAPDSPANAPT